MTKKNKGRKPKYGTTMVHYTKRVPAESVPKINALIAAEKTRLLIANTPHTNIIGPWDEDKK